MDTGRREGMTRRSGIAAVLLMMAASPALPAAPALDGEWQGKLVVDPNTSLTVRFTFTRASAAAYTAVLNSPDNPEVKDTPVSDVKWDGTSLSFSVPSLSGAYAGRFANGRISGEWSQPGGKLPLELAPWQKPTLSAEAARQYVGAWNGELALGPNKQRIVFRFQQQDGGLAGTLAIPDQGLVQPMTDVAVEDGVLSLRSLQGRLEFKGRLSGGRLAGRLKVPSPMVSPDGVDFTLQRGDYQPPPVPLKLDAAAWNAVKGRWSGTLLATNPQTGQQSELPVILRFERNDKGEVLAHIGSPAQGAQDTVVNDAALVDGRLTIRIDAWQASYAGTLSGNRISGDFTQAGQRRPLELTRMP